MTKDEFVDFTARISIVKLTLDEEFVLQMRLLFLRHMENTTRRDPELPAGVPASLFESFKDQGARAMRDSLEKQIAEYEATRPKSRKKIKEWEKLKQK